MNLWWEVFNVDDTALGGWLANGARLATVIVAVLLTIYKDKIWKPLPSEAEDVDINGSEKAAESKTPASLTQRRVCRKNVRPHDRCGPILALRDSSALTISM